jgi:hypothetical protein
MTPADHMNRIYYGFIYQFCDRSKWNVYSSQATNALLLTADEHEEEGGDAAELTPFFLNRERQGEFLPQHMIDNEDEAADDEESSYISPVEDEEDAWQCVILYILQI